MIGVINSRVIKTDLVRWQDFQFIQDDDFKEWIGNGDKKLLQSLVKYQFADPFKVWENNGVIYCLDGKHRWIDLKKAKESGVQVPDFLPATFINCTDITEAAEMVLVYSSAYARITEMGLYQFSIKFDLNISELGNNISFPDLNLEKFEGDINTDFSQKNDELDINEFTGEVTLKLLFSKSDYLGLKNKLDALVSKLGLSSKEQVILKVIMGYGE